MGKASRTGTRGQVGRIGRLLGEGSRVWRTESVIASFPSGLVYTSPPRSLLSRTNQNKSKKLVRSAARFPSYIGVETNLMPPTLPFRDSYRALRIALNAAPRLSRPA